MTDASSNRAHGKTPSDDQIDGLLRDFFRLETPTELNQPFRRDRLKSAAGTSLTISPVAEHVPRSGRWIAVASVLTALALSLVAFVQLDRPGDADNSPVVDKTGAPTRPTATSEDLMLVSPHGDLKSSSTIGADGVTLEETDGIELSLFGSGISPQIQEAEGR